MSITCWNVPDLPPLYLHTANDEKLGGGKVLEWG